MTNYYVDAQEIIFQGNCSLHSVTKTQINFIFHSKLNTKHIASPKLFKWKPYRQPNLPAVTS